MAELHAGVARATITPAVGTPMVGFAGRGPSGGVHDDLYVTALALESGGAGALVLALDLLGISDAFTAEVRAEVTRRTGVPGEGVWLCASHTHYGPSTGAHGDDPPPEVAAYLANLKYLLTGAAQAAWTSRQPVHASTAAGCSAIGVNRRERLPDGRVVLGQNPAGPCDRGVRLVRLDMADGAPLAALVNFACHPVSAGAPTREISADWVGVMRALAERETGAACVFLQGAAGNINPVEMRPSFEPARRLGTALGGEVLKLFTEAQPCSGAGLALASERLELPAMRFDTAAEGAQAVADLRAALEQLRAQGPASGPVYWAESRLKRAEGMLESVRSGVPLPAIPAEIAALRFGGVVIAAAPGEIFTETGAAVKRRSSAPYTCFTGYSNGSIGYVPLPSAYPEGGYEVTHACRVAPEAAGMIEDAAVRLIGACVEKE